LENIQFAAERNCRGYATSLGGNNYFEDEENEAP
jgi:hypothetical protein